MKMAETMMRRGKAECRDVQKNGPSDWAKKMPLSLCSSYFQTFLQHK